MDFSIVLRFGNGRDPLEAVLEIDKEPAIPARRTRDWFEQWIARLLLAALITSLFSIFVTGLCLAAGFVLWILDCRNKGRVHLKIPSFGPPVLLFLGLFLLSALFSEDPWVSIVSLRKALRMTLPFFLFTYFTRNDVEQGLKGLFLVLGGSALFGVLQYAGLKEVDLLNRIDGFMSHWMTFSGQLMLSSIALTGFLLFGLARRWFAGAVWLLPLLLAVQFTALLLALTRSAWLGAFVGLMLLLLVFSFRWVMPAILLLGLMLTQMPAQFQARLYSGFDPADTTTRIRLELLDTGSKMIGEHPWLGVGPAMVSSMALQYKNSEEFPDWVYQHLHNNLMQVAVEYGIPAALVWCLLWLWMARDFIRMRRRFPNDRLLGYLALNGLATLAAFLTAGLFEYNFGDSEIVMLLFFFVTAPYVLYAEKTV